MNQSRQERQERQERIEYIITVPTKYHAGQFLKLNSPTLKQLQKVHKGKSLYIY